MYFRQLVMSLCVFSMLSVSTSSYADSSFNNLSRSEFLEHLETTMESFWESSSLIYTRINPELKELVPGKEWNDEDRDAQACIYDKIVAQGDLDEYIAYLDNIPKTEKIIIEDTSINAFNMHENPELQQMPDFEGYLTIIDDCGYLSLAQKRMTESGFWEKFRSSAPE